MRSAIANDDFPAASPGEAYAEHRIAAWKFTRSDDCRRGTRSSDYSGLSLMGGISLVPPPITERSETCSERSDEVRDYNLHTTQTKDCT